MLLVCAIDVGKTQKDIFVIWGFIFRGDFRTSTKEKIEFTINLILGGGYVSPPKLAELKKHIENLIKK